MALRAADLPEVRGQLRENADLSHLTWFQVGGPAEILFRPVDETDLSEFIKQLPKTIPYTVLGASSNLLIRDGGIKGVVIKLPRHFAQISHQGTHIIAGASALDINIAKYAEMNLMGGVEFLSGIPGTFGGALFMNAGAYGTEIKDVLLWAEAIDETGTLKRFSTEDLKFEYRKSIGHHQRLIFTKGCLKTNPDQDSALIRQKMQEIADKRSSSQPIKSRTGGSTFANPPGYKAWELIDKAGCRGLRIGGAHMSELHCNFMLNDQDATAADIEALGNEVQRRVLAHSGIQLEWEIKIIGEKGNS